MTIEEFETGYIKCALWLAERECDWGFFDVSDIEDEHLREETESELKSFYEDNLKLIEDRAEQAGHDFYLTRNGHGAGFWDGDWPEPAATKLTQAAKVYGSTDDLDLYLKGDDEEVSK